jgi:23S rRNA pseudouridine955/2504/2580 synthase
VNDVRTFTVSEDDDGIRLDRWFKRHLPDVSFNLVSRWARTGQLRLGGKRAVPGDRVEAGQEIRVPPLEATPTRAARQPNREPLSADEEQFVRDTVIYQDPAAFVLNKPPGLATQGGTKTHQHLDRLLDGLAGEAGRPKLVHRLDKDGWTRIRPERCSSHGTHARPAISRRRLRDGRRARSIGRWWSASPLRTKG